MGRELDRLSSEIESQGFSTGARLLKSFAKSLEREGLIPPTLGESRELRELSRLEAQKRRVDTVLDTGLEYVSIDQACEILGVTRPTVYLRIRRNDINIHHKSKDRRSFISTSDLRSISNQ